MYLGWTYWDHKMFDDARQTSSDLNQWDNNPYFYFLLPWSLIIYKFFLMLEMLRTVFEPR